MKIKSIPLFVLSLALWSLLTVAAAESPVNNSAVNLSLHTAILLIAENKSGNSERYEEAKNLLLPQKKNEDPIAQFYLAQTFDSSCFGVQDFCPFQLWLKKSAVNGNPTALFLYGLQTFELGKSNYAESTSWIRQAVRKGHPTANVHLTMMLLEAVDESETDEERIEACKAVSQNTQVLITGAFKDLALVGCNKISMNTFMQKSLRLSVEGKADYSFFTSFLFEYFSEPERALRYARLAQNQLKDLPPNSLFAIQTFTRDIELDEFIASLEVKVQQNAQQDSKERTARLLSSESEITISLADNYNTNWEKQRDRPFVRFMGKTAELTLYAIAMGLSAAADNYAQNAQSNSSSALLGSNYDGNNPSIGYNANASEEFNSFSNSSCRCACVNGEKVSLCTSAIAVAAICAGSCPVYLPRYEAPNITPPPPGASQCRNKQVFDDGSKSYKTKTVCQ